MTSTQIEVSHGTLRMAVAAQRKIDDAARKIINRLKTEKVQKRYWFFLFKKEISKWEHAKSKESFFPIRYLAWIMDYISDDEYYILAAESKQYTSPWESYMDRGERFFLSHEEYMSLLNIIKIAGGLEEEEEENQ